MKRRKIAFDEDKYLEVQKQTLYQRLASCQKNGRVYLEFGGKVYDDQHAARVLPGFNPDLKLKVLHELNNSFEFVIVVSARDLLKPRIRGDSQLFYDSETVRVVDRLRKYGIDVRFVVISMIQSNKALYAMLDHIKTRFQSELGVTVFEHYYIPQYPAPFVLQTPEVFEINQRLDVGNSKNVLVLSPGGGSAKFGVCLSELVVDFVSGKNSTFIKYETFPVFDLPPTHPVNRAFVAATADLGNIALAESDNGRTSYDKDIENFALLKEACMRFCPDRNVNPIANYRFPSDMGINKLTAGFVDEKLICRAAETEIQRRDRRYRSEIKRKIEHGATLEHLLRHSMKI